MKMKNWRMVVNLVDLVSDNKFGVVALQFETYYQLNGKYVWNNKVNAWVDWLHDMWNNGQVSLSEYRYLIGVDME